MRTGIYRLCALAASCLWAVPLAAENWIQDGDFESKQPVLWRAAQREPQVVHAGKGALRLDEPANRPSVSAAYEKPIPLNQKEPETLMAAFWVRMEAKRQTGPIRGGVTFHVKMADGTSQAWYGPFEIEPSSMGSWVYREGRWKPKAPVASIHPSVYLRGVEGSIYVDDLYLGPATELPAPKRTPIPLAVTGGNGRFGDFARFAVNDFRPAAHVFHLADKNQANLVLDCEINVEKTAPAYLSSNTGSQYWTLYCPERRQLAQICTNERLDLSRPGSQTVPVPMNRFSPGASDLTPGGYMFLTDCSKSFLIYRTEKPVAGTRQTPGYCDTVKVEVLSNYLGSSGVAAPFSLADLTRYSLSFAAQTQRSRLLVRPTLLDARQNRVPLYGLELQAEAGGRSVKLAPKVDAEGVPTGDYWADVAPPKSGSIELRGMVRLATPAGTKDETIREVLAVGPPVVATALPSRRLDLLGCGYPSYELSTKESHGPDGMRRLFVDAKKAAITKLIIHARTSTMTFYPSRIAPKTQLAEWDAMKAAVSEGHREGVAVYAGYILGVAAEEDLKAHPDWAALDRAGKQNGWYCYNHPQVRSYHTSLLREIVGRYAVAGVFLDYCRPEGGCFCPHCSTAFQAKYQKPLSKIDPYDVDWRAWQRESITDYMRQLSRAVRSERAGAQFSAYVWGRFAPDKDRAGQDWPRWLKEGIMDFVAVGMYTPSTPWFRAQCHVLREIADRELNGQIERIYALAGPGYIQRARPAHREADAVIARHLRAAGEEGLSAAGVFPFYAVRTHLDTMAAFGRIDR